MRDDKRSLDGWQQSLQELDLDLERRESLVLSGEPGDQELMALAIERDKIAEEWRDLADARDREAHARDLRAEDREARTRNGTTDLDAQTFPAGERVNDASIDRAEARSDRAHSAADRVRADTARQHAAADRAVAFSRARQAATEMAQLHEAIETRTVIGQAVGMFMERYQLDADAAFAVLVRLSQQSNTKLRNVAGAVIKEHDQNNRPTVPNNPVEKKSH